MSLGWLTFERWSDDVTGVEICVKGPCGETDSGYLCRKSQMSEKASCSPTARSEIWRRTVSLTVHSEEDGVALRARGRPGGKRRALCDALSVLVVGIMWALLFQVWGLWEVTKQNSLGFASLAKIGECFGCAATNSNINPERNRHPLPLFSLGNVQKLK